ncbi:hypothetical protein AYI68_g1582 [Smittium mucronatum]|uniref:Little elongation complex subunit 2 C-terminal domain-containing protein n=1 Tax=Smittium mucronatum TaxID=133383 RepID=A0A1R0H592_9FUNG|nr:hypothetical protein AYI68_g1582 [Smittium mucronatum]
MDSRIDLDSLDLLSKDASLYDPISESNVNSQSFAERFSGTTLTHSPSDMHTISKGIRKVNKIELTSRTKNKLQGIYKKAKSHHGNMFNTDRIYKELSTDKRESKPMPSSSEFITCEKFFEYSILADTPRKRSLLLDELDFDKIRKGLRSSRRLSISKKESTFKSKDQKTPFSETVGVNPSLVPSKTDVSIPKFDFQNFQDVSTDLPKVAINPFVPQSYKSTAHDNQTNKFVQNNQTKTSICPEKLHIPIFPENFKIIDNVSNVKSIIEKSTSESSTKKILGSLLKITSKDSAISNNVTTPKVYNTKDSATNSPEILKYNKSLPRNSNIATEHLTSKIEMSDIFESKTKDSPSDHSSLLTNEISIAHISSKIPFEYSYKPSFDIISTMSPFPAPLFMAALNNIGEDGNPYFNEIEFLTKLSKIDVSSLPIENHIKFFSLHSVPCYISADDIAKNQALENEADIVISEEALLCLFTMSNTLSRNILIPVISKTVNNVSVPFIDSPIETKDCYVSESYLNYSILEKLSSELLTDKSKKHFFDENDESSDSDNFNYTMWKFGSIKILIRFRVQCYLLENNHLNKKSVQTVTLVPVYEPSLDISPKFLPEPDWLRAYLRAYIRGRSKLAICHFAADPKHHFNLFHVGVCSASDLICNSYPEFIDILSNKPNHYSSPNKSPDSIFLAFQHLHKVLSFIKESVHKDIAQQPAKPNDGQFMLYRQQFTSSASIYSEFSDRQSEHHVDLADNSFLDIREVTINQSTANPDIKSLNYDFTPSSMVWPKIKNHVPYIFPTTDEIKILEQMGNDQVP